MYRDHASRVNTLIYTAHSYAASDSLNVRVSAGCTVMGMLDP
eukprot:COSAG01_NODE_21207_length_913_cov_0.886978_3_plen_41_part_01